MRALVIKGMEMPEFCTLCPCSSFMLKNLYCEVMGVEIADENIKKRAKPSWCPLTELSDGLYQVQGERVWKYHGKGEKL